MVRFYAEGLVGEVERHHGAAVEVVMKRHDEVGGGEVGEQVGILGLCIEGDLQQAQRLRRLLSRPRAPHEVDDAEQVRLSPHGAPRVGHS